MDRIEKTVFLSYRRTNIPWALAIFQNLTQFGYDVFFDYKGIASGDFEQVILENITARAHFIVLLTPSALERCHDRGDWLRREIETALKSERNIVPLMLEGFDFGSPVIARHLIGSLSGLKKHNGLRILQDYFDEGMERLRDKYLNVPVTAGVKPASVGARRAAAKQKAAATAAPQVKRTELTAQQWFERGFAATDEEEKLRSYDEAIRLMPGDATALFNRGVARRDKGDLDGALRDYDQAIQFQPDYADAFYNRGLARDDKGDNDGALKDYSKAILLKPDFAHAFVNRGLVRKTKGDLDGALRDFNEAIRLQPYDADAFYNRGLGRYAKGDLDGAMRDYDEAIRLNPDFADAYFNRAFVHQKRASGSGKAAIADYQRYLDLGGGVRHGDQSRTEKTIRDLQKKL
jgi:tetratricopeptide (TPR) repeat protein